MLVKDLFEDSWSGPNNAWHNQGQDDQWHNGQDQWHSEPTTEDFNTANLVQTNEADMSDIITARSLIGHAFHDHDKKHEYFKFLKHLRNRHGADYSTSVHKQAARLAGKAQ
jgi:hypothetical protein